MDKEIVGRKYEWSRFAVHSRRVGSKDWYGASRYKTMEEARTAIEQTGSRFMDIGGLTIDFGEATDLFEYRIVKVDAQCEVLETCFAKV